MLTGTTVAAADRLFDELRAREFARLDATGMAYLDYAGAALYAESHLDAHRTLLSRGVFGNPHAENAASTGTTHAIESARRTVLRSLDADDDYLVCFTANATAAIKLVAESYPFRPGTACVLAADNHNSVNGVREFARRAGAEIVSLPLRDDLRLDHPEARLGSIGREGLLAFPAQSNFSGVHHPLSLVTTAQALGFHVLLDAAAFVPAHPLSLRACPADFVALSFYKIFGYPTGVGALVARRDALATLRRPWFAGGTVDYASVQLSRHRLRHGAESFEDGTANFLDIFALEAGFAWRDRIGLTRVSARVQELTAGLLKGLASLRHSNEAPLVRTYGPATNNSSAASQLDRRGGTVAFNVLARNGQVVPFGVVEQRANAAGVLLRGGCFCNPGAAEAAFQLDADRMARCLDAIDEDFTIPRLQQCAGPDVTIGAVRASVGPANNHRDISRALDLIASFAK